ncbi:hypothetical protein M409DRAFT_25705 [Zasmidium cellare ATCC 36951]|uniref:RING-type domain-containing protein n=1 Tax=Zasmidium cellare ATCC 36951 TaxID=1080233 RepID=A0A6A6CCL8_ZASCE|nr:uncharacterized protein M409DRAFT_25705 [Zasmidium cellare ATCC 36951]KAF2163928.1 hypothetical protein M409DRAFT_25705 [Zasmidium cellare ATCC 36951]
MPTRDEFLDTGLQPVSNPAEGVHCPICDEDPPVNLIRLPCHETHIYCQPCAVQWLQQRGVNTCPHCRTALFDLPPEELVSENEEDGEIVDEDEDEDEVVDMEDEDIWEYEDEDEDDNGSLAGGYYAGDEEEEGDEPDEADDAGGEALREDILAEIRGMRERCFGPGVDHDRLDRELLARVEANRDGEDLLDDDDENDDTDRESSSLSHEVQRRRRQLRIDSGDLREQLLATEEERSRSPPRSTSGDDEQEEEGAASDLAAPAAHGSNSGDGELLDQDWEKRAYLADVESE